ncbi:PEP-CTERM sorting domain-containing protein [Nitrosovibrio sp. Nv4]|uniref:PEP-CTERM sorting domain-containing protein n=1 Tax=Nitrosovibrio sp. Nv4 TaxID=1945880 RepID=UPI000BCAE4BB|nr:PEP-CTERM sorting domain-containing protein [Nitrosovibrio sp. Nv4]SOD40459.1 PEP-CTERM protein-sorting domain-containing protein [Nitrosovibrio sp. Nv4]
MKLKTLFVACGMSLILPAHAALTSNVNGISNPHVIDFENFDGFITTGPETVASGVSFTGTSGSVLGAFIADLGSNGLWGAGNHFAATDVIGTLHFTFVNGLTSAAGALLNSHNGNPMFISAFADNHQIIESHIINVDTLDDSLNAGTFFGIMRPTADIRSISFTGLGLVADNVTFTTPVPEPEAYAMMLAGLGLMGLVARRRRKNLAAA